MASAERSQRLPVALTSSWTALTPPAQLPCSPTKLRPIAVLPVMWRIWAKCYLELLDEWTQSAMPPNLHSYIRGRSAALAASALAAKLDGISRPSADHQYYVAGLDLSKAFPSVSRAQLFETLSRMGMPRTILKLTESLYMQGHTRFRLLGRIASPRQHRLKRGIHQGYPLSVMSFNALQVPLLKFMKDHHSEDEVLAYADDLIVISLDKPKLEAALSDIAEYMDATNIQLNEAKTRFWCSSGTTGPLQFRRSTIDAEHIITLLGMTIVDAVTSKPPHQDAERIQTAIRKLTRLPLSVQARQSLYAAVTGAQLSYCPWRSRWFPKALSGARASIISGLRPALHKGARAQGMVMIFLLRGHRVDPLLSQLISLFSIIAKLGVAVIGQLEWAIRIKQFSNGPVGELAYLCDTYGLAVEKGHLYYDEFAPVTMKSGKDADLPYLDLPLGTGLPFKVSCCGGWTGLDLLPMFGLLP